MDLKLPAPPRPQDMEKEERPPGPREAKESNPVSKEGKPPPHAGNSRKVEKRDKVRLEKMKEREYMVINWSEGKKGEESHSKGTDVLSQGSRRQTKLITELGSGVKSVGG